jgi:dolichol-phosphate mannosyltransferase
LTEASLQRSLVSRDGKIRPLVVIPTYNEAEGIEALLTLALTVHPDLKILVVDDSSPDGTGEIVSKLAETNDRLELMTREAKQGLGRAYLAGFSRGLGADHDCFIEMDADLSHDPADLPRLLETVENGADVVIGSRYVRGGGVSGWSRRRHLLSWSANKYAKSLLGLPTRDSTSGFRCYRREVLESLDLTSIATDGYAFQVEMTYLAWRAGFNIVEIPIVFRERSAGKSKMSRQIVVEGLVWVTTRGARELRRRLRNGISNQPR